MSEIRFGLHYKLKKEDWQYLKNKKRGNAFDSECSSNRISIHIPYISTTLTKCLYVHPKTPFIIDSGMRTDDESSQLNLLFREKLLNERKCC